MSEYNRLRKALLTKIAQGLGPGPPEGNPFGPPPKNMKYGKPVYAPIPNWPKPQAQLKGYQPGGSLSGLNAPKDFGLVSRGPAFDPSAQTLGLDTPAGPATKHLSGPPTENITRQFPKQFVPPPKSLNYMDSYMPPSVSNAESVLAEMDIADRRLREAGARQKIKPGTTTQSLSNTRPEMPSKDELKYQLAESIGPKQQLPAPSQSQQMENAKMRFGDEVKALEKRRGRAKMSTQNLNTRVTPEMHDLMNPQDLTTRVGPRFSPDQKLRAAGVTPSGMGRAFENDPQLKEHFLGSLDPSKSKDSVMGHVKGLDEWGKKQINQPFPRDPMAGPTAPKMSPPISAPPTAPPMKSPYDTESTLGYNPEISQAIKKKMPSAAQAGSVAEAERKALAEFIATGRSRPAASRAASQVAEAAPSASRAASQVAEAAPSASRAASQVAEAAPSASRAASQVAEAAPAAQRGRIAKFLEASKDQANRAYVQPAKATGKGAVQALKSPGLKGAGKLALGLGVPAALMYGANEIGPNFWGGLEDPYAAASGAMMPDPSSYVPDLEVPERTQEALSHANEQLQGLTGAGAPPTMPFIPGAAPGLTPPTASDFGEIPAAPTGPNPWPTPAPAPGPTSWSDVQAPTGPNPWMTPAPSAGAPPVVSPLSSSQQITPQLRQALENAGTIEPTPPTGRGGWY